MSRPDGDVPMRHAADADLDAAFGDAVRHAYAHAARIDDLTARRHAKAAAAVVQRGEVGSWWRTASLAHRRRRIGGLTAKAAAVTVAGMVASTGLAAANVLPAPAARAIVRVVGAVGLPVPQSIETAAEPKHDVDTTARPEGEQALQPIDPTTAGAAGATSADPDATSTTVAGASTSTTAGGVGTSATTATSVDAVTPTSLVPVFVDECPTSTTAVRPVFPSTTVLFPSTTESTTTTTAGTTSTTSGAGGSTTTSTVGGDDDACAQGEEVPSTTTSTTSTTSTTATSTPPDEPTSTTTPEDAPASADG